MRSRPRSTEWPDGAPAPPLQLSNKGHCAALHHERLSGVLCRARGATAPFSIAPHSTPPVRQENLQWMKGSTMAFIGKLPKAGPRAPSGRWWRGPLPRKMPKAGGRPGSLPRRSSPHPTRQGATSPGGAKNYVVNGKMTEGFAFVAFPAEYRCSGVMTFIVGEDGVVYQKDLGSKTEVLGKAMKEYNLNSSWKKSGRPAGRDCWR